MILLCILKTANPVEIRLGCTHTHGKEHRDKLKKKKEKWTLAKTLNRRGQGERARQVKVKIPQSLRRGEEKKSGQMPLD